MHTKIEILYEDNHLIVIDKPAGLPSQGDESGDPSAIDLVATYIKEKYKKPGNVFVHLAHRLDRPVSGVLMLCKTSKGLARMMKQFKDRTIDKAYIAVTAGQPKRIHYKLEHHLVKNRKKNISFVADPDDKRAKLAILAAEVLHSHGGYSLLRIYPETGRSHQIRVQLAHIGLPLVGDVKYRGQRQSRFRNICLHSHELSFDHPTTRERMTVTSLPSQAHWQKFGQLVVRVGGHGSLH